MEQLAAVAQGRGIVPLSPEGAPPGKHIQELGGCNPSQGSGSPSCGDPINVLTGNFWQTDLDLALPDRGPALSFARTYNSNLADTLDAGLTGGSVGYGWTHSYAMYLSEDCDGIACSQGHYFTVHQENASTVVFQIRLKQRLPARRAI